MLHFRIILLWSVFVLSSDLSLALLENLFSRTRETIDLTANESGDWHFEFWYVRIKMKVTMSNQKVFH